MAHHLPTSLLSVGRRARTWAVVLVAAASLLVPAAPARAAAGSATTEEPCGGAPADWFGEVLLGSGSGSFRGEVATAHTDRFYEARLTLSQLLGSRTATLTLIQRERSGGPVIGQPLTYEGPWEIRFLSSEVRVAENYPGGQFLLKLDAPSCSGEDPAEVTSARLITLHTPDDGQFIPSGSSWVRQNP